MPVGNCLSGEKGDEQDLSPPFNNATISSFNTFGRPNVYNMVEQFAFLQQTLLVQIFRLSNSNVSSSIGSMGCSACSAFSNVCCQQTNGKTLFYDFLNVNLSNLIWDSQLEASIQGLRYQGYICPGILVIMSSSKNIQVFIDAWRRRLIMPPHNSEIKNIGLSNNGCNIKSIFQASSASLSDIICILLTRLKGSNDTANIDTLCSLVESDWNEYSKMDNLRESIYSTLGNLIKQRRVYYTGNSGYFLVDSSGACGTGINSTSEAKMNKLRHLIKINAALLSPMSVASKECQTFNSNYDSFRSTGASLGKSFNSSMQSNIKGLERSQSLRIKRNPFEGLEKDCNKPNEVMKSHINKGGSLRLSKKESAPLELLKCSDLSSDKKSVAVPDSSLGEDYPKCMDRKNSFLSKLFCKSKLKYENKPDLATFSAQFPPRNTTNYEYQENSRSPSLDTKKSPTFLSHSTKNKHSSNNVPLLPQYPNLKKGLKSSGNSKEYLTNAASSTLYNSSDHKVAYKDNQITVNQGQDSEKNIYEQPKRRFSQVCVGQTLFNSPTLSNSVDYQLTNEDRDASSSNEAFVLPKLFANNPKKNGHPVDTIHNNHNPTQEIIYEVESVLESEHKDFIPKPGNLFENKSSLQSEDSVLSSKMSVPTKEFSLLDGPRRSPAFCDKDLEKQNFKSITAQKLIAGLSFNSIDTLLEVNAAAENRNKINESTETIDFGVI